MTARGGAGPGTVGVIGLGLIGGSLARDLAARGARVLGYDRDPDTMRAGLAEGVLAGTLAADHAGAALESDAEGEQAALPGLEQVDTVLLALPGDAAVALLAREQVRLRRRPLVMDVGSTKRRVVRHAAALGLAHFIGAHPLAGSERAGWKASRRGLFSGATVYLCPPDDCDPSVLARAESFWRALGSRPEHLPADAHDALLAWSSHLPQLAATVLGLALAGRGIARTALGPGGRDTTRLAASDAALWTGIALENADLLMPAVAALEANVGRLRIALLERDTEKLRAAFAAAAEWAAT